MAAAPALTAKVLEALSSSGLLLEQDKRLPNLVTVLTGQSLTTSWWSHPEARLIFAVLTELSDHPDVLFTKLVHRKVTLVHRSLWPALLAVAAAGEPWQLDRLSAPARSLLSVVNGSKEAVRCSGKPAKEIEARLLAHATQVHTESGRHETALEPWPVWRRRARIEPLLSPALGRRRLESAARAIDVPVSALPWPAAVRST